MDVSIRPSEERSDIEKQKLINFIVLRTNINDFLLLIEAAKEAIGLNSEIKNFNKNILRIKISGPEQFYLTFINLLSFFYSLNK